jgi:hypothetical protein
MSTSNSGESQGLTEDEMVLHHYAATIGKGIEAYRASAFKDAWEGLWRFTLKLLLVFFTLAICCDSSELICFR